MNFVLVHLTKQINSFFQGEVKRELQELTRKNYFLLNKRYFGSLINNKV